MFANYQAQGVRRRGIILVLILGMLGLLALIGVTFATFAGQSLINARNFNLSENRPEADQYMDFALAQLINDTNNPLSAIRGHGLLRDMYGNDSVHRGTTAGEIKGYLDRVLVPNNNPPPQYNQVALQFTAAQTYPNKNSPFYAMGLRQYQTNIPTGATSYLYYGLNFTRWVLRMTGGGVAQTFEVLEDDDTGSYHVFTMSQNLPQFQLTPGSTTAPYPLTTDPFGETVIYSGQTVLSTIVSGNTVYSENFGYPINLTPLSLVTNSGTGTSETFPYTFVLDGRYMRAFNGPGMSRSLVAQSNALNSASANSSYLAPFNVAAFGNFRFNGYFIDPVYMANVGIGNGNASPTSTLVGDPDLFGMDEDYDAADLENWFIAVQSADGQVVIPSFHRPGILTALDWTATASTNASAYVAGVSKILRPRAADNSPGFPVDPSTPDAVTGKLTYDVDNDGDGVTDSVWLDLGYPVQKDPNGKLFKPLFAFMVIGQNGRLPLNTVGNLQGRDYQFTKNYNNPMGAATPTVQINPLTVYDAPTWDHTSHLGVSANEVNPKYALQNAPANIYSSNVINQSNGTATGNIPTMGDSYFSQVDNAGIDVSLTQIRNILAGTVPEDNPTAPSNAIPQENNFVAVNGAAYYMPNGVIDAQDNGYNTMTPGNSFVTRNIVTPVPGRWGEPEGVPRYLSVPQMLQNTANNALSANGINILPYIYTNPVRGGRSFYSWATSNLSTANSFTATADGVDDDFDSVDPPLFGGPAEYSLPLDAAGQVSIATKRIQRFVTPFDPAATGRVVDWMSRPTDLYDYGTGYDNMGHVGYFRYFRPAGMPGHVQYLVPYSSATPANNSPAAYLMPLIGDATASSLTAQNLPNGTNNRYHGYEGFRAPVTNSGAGTYSGVAAASKVAVFGAMPYDYFGNGTTDQPVAGNLTTTYLSGTAKLQTPSESTFVNSESGPYYFGNVPPGTTIYPPNFDQTFATVVNGYPFGSLNKDEADEMNLYSSNNNDQQFGPTDLEWLYRKQDVDGSTLTSRLSSLAPISFLNPKDGLTRRRMFSLESWDMNSFVYANDNPNGAFPYNSRFGQFASANLETINQIVGPVTNQIITDPNYPDFFANQFATEALPNPTLPTPISTWTPNSTTGALGLPYLLSAGQPETGGNATSFAATSFPVSQYSTTNFPARHYDQFVKPVPGDGIATPTMTPSLAIRDRRINLNFPFPVASDPAEPVRQKWIRETYQLLKTILPPQAIDTPQELAALSQFVVNIVDFRDPDGTYTRFVNTDIQVVPAAQENDSVTPPLAASQPSIQFATIACPTVTEMTPAWDFSASPTPHTFYPYDPMIAYEQTVANPNAMPPVGTVWTTAMKDSSNNPLNPFLVQYGMEYNPVGLNEILCYSFTGQSTVNATGTTPVDRFYVELVNTLIDDSSHAASGLPSSTGKTTGMANTAVTNPGSEDIELRGWDMVIMPDTVDGRPDPITGCLPSNIGGIAINPAPPTAPAANNLNPINPTTNIAGPGGTLTLVSPSGTGTPSSFPVNSIGWAIGSTGLTSRIPAIRNFAGGTQVVPYYYDMANPKPTADQAPVDASPDALMPATFLPQLPPPSATMPAPARPVNTQGQFFWLYLRRPANPFNNTGEMVVVDSMRFPWVTDNGVGTISGPDSNGSYSMTSTVGTTPLFSAQRQQPFRGGQVVAPIPPTNAMAPASTPVVPASAYGFYDQTVGLASTALSDVGPPGSGTTTATSYPKSNPPPMPQPAGTNYGGAGYWTYTTQTSSTAAPVTQYKQVTPDIAESIGAATTSARLAPLWDHFPFHDRDFTSVGELLLVPGCPPGLFTKQFIEKAFSFSNAAPVPLVLKNLTQGNAPPTQTNQAISSFPGAAAPAFPYLPDEFYYTGASVNPDPNGSKAPYPNQIGGMTGAGWYKMFDFFEVPSSANGAIGLAANGENFDWFRADRRPGAINLNLIYDEEVFFGLIDDPRLNIELAQFAYNLNNTYNGNTNAVLPQVVSQINALGGVAASYPISDGTIATVTQLYPGATLASASAALAGNGLTTQNVGRGFTYGDPSTSNVGSSQQTITGMKAAFADFIKLRHGGTNFIQAHQGEGSATGFTDQIFHSLSYPDINYTIMRPGTPRPPAAASTLYNTMSGLVQYTWTTPSHATPMNGPPASPLSNNLYANMPTAGGLLWDPGVRFPWMDLTFENVNGTASAYNVALSNYTTSPITGMTTQTLFPMIPPTPPRRLFQIPDANPTSNASTAGDTINLNGAGLPAYTNPFLADQASELVTANSYPMTTGVVSNFVAQPPGANPSNYNTSIVAPTVAITLPTASPTVGVPAAGGSYKQQSWFLAGNSQHPVYRTEMLQKVMNLSTVRTHQFAVWITVGFFEVTKAGTPELGISDILGGELNVAAGTDVRYRSFFTIDRTQATGYNPYFPSDFRSCVTYRHQIE